MKFKFKWYMGKSAFFPLPLFLLRLFVYIDCWNIMAINTIIIIIIVLMNPIASVCNIPIKLSVFLTD